MAEEQGKSRSRSMRDGKWYWADKAVIQQYVRRVGFLAIAVYHFLASMADENQSCYPSQKYIADRLGCSRWSVNQAVKKLRESRLIGCAKAVGRSNTYHLLPVPMSSDHTGGVGSEPINVCETEDTNDNKEQDKDNNIVVSDLKTHNTTKEPNGETETGSRQELLANDLAEALNDRSHYTIYLSYAKQYSESFLRRVLAETKMTPDKKIKKSRAALFNYLVYHYAGQRN